MHTKLLMGASASAMLLAGIALTFAPQELLSIPGSCYHPETVLILQAAGALYMGFALLNWMAKDSLIGGIYSRPVAMGNFLHFLIVTMALVKALAAGTRTTGVIAAALVFALLAAWFGLVVFGSPFRSKT